MNDTQNISDILAGKKSINVDASIPTDSIVWLSVGVFLSVLFAVLIANFLNKK